MSNAKTNDTNSIEPGEATLQMHESARAERIRKQWLAIAEIDTQSVTKPAARKIEVDPFDLPIAAKVKTQSATATPAAEKQLSADAIFSAVPSEVLNKFEKIGSNFYDKEHAEAVAFVDKGTKLETKLNSDKVVDSLVHIAKARGWDEITVKGSDIFKREVWLEASKNDIAVKGYTPTAEDQAKLAKHREANPTNSIEGAPSRGRDKPSSVAVPAPVAPTAEQAFLKASDFKKRDAQAAQKIDALTASQVKAKQEKHPPEVARKLRSEIKNTKGERELAEANHTAALSFVRNAEKEGIREHPQLAAFYAVQRATEQQFKQSGMSAEQQKIAAHALKAQLASQIEKGAQLSVHIREPAPQREPDKEAQR